MISNRDKLGRGLLLCRATLTLGKDGAGNNMADRLVDPHRLDNFPRGFHHVFRIFHLRPPCFPNPSFAPYPRLRRGSQAGGTAGESSLALPRPWLVRVR